MDESGEGGGDEGNILPIMQSIMQNLLSKEVLYPSLKEITTKVCVFLIELPLSPVYCYSATHNCLSPFQYPEWLDANKPSLSPEDYQRYEQQAKIMGDICKHFEKEEEAAGDKENKFENIMDLMQQVKQHRLTCSACLNT